MWTYVKSYVLLSFVITLNLAIAAGCGAMDRLAVEPPPDHVSELEKSSGPGAKSDQPDMEDVAPGESEEDVHVEDSVETDTEHQRSGDGGGGEPIGDENTARLERDAEEDVDVPEVEDVVDAENGLQGCALLCDSMARCEGLPGGLSVIECQIGCEVSLYDASVTERDIRCMVRAKNCGDVRFCVNDLHGCDGACDAVMGCGVFEDGIDCYSWCGPQILSGALTVSQMGCMEGQAREGRCNQLVDLCSLNGLP